MRGFSGLYFFLICLVYLCNAFVPSRDLKLFPFIYASLISVASAILIAFIKPYKQRYMNVLETLFLAHFTVICILLSRKYFSQTGDGTQIFAIMLIPAIVFKLPLFFKVCKKFKNVLVKWCKDYYNNSLENSEIIDNP